MSPPFHLTVDDVNMKMDSYPATSGGIHRWSQVSPRIFWDGERVVYHLLGRNGSTSWETEQDLEQYSNVVERYWVSEPKQVGRENAKYRAYRVQMAKQLQTRSAGEVCSDVPSKCR